MFTPLAHTLKDAMSDRRAILRQVGAAETVEAAERALIECLGKEVASLIKPLYVKNRTLTLSCTSAAAAQEVRLAQTRLLEKTNEIMGRKEVDRIRYLA